MSISNPVSVNKHIVSSRLLMLGAAIYNFVALWLIAGWQSDQATILGHYSLGVVLAFLGFALLGIAYLLLSFAFDRQLENYLQKIPQKYRLAFLVLLALICFGFLQLSFRPGLVTTFTVNALVLSAIIILSLTDYPFPTKGIRWLLLALIIFVTFTTFITVMIARPYDPDEAIWGSAAISGFVHDGFYDHVGFYHPYHIIPGMGWVTAIYGYLLQSFAYNLQIGRIMQFIIYTMTVGAIGFLATRLYNWRIGFVAMLIAFFSSAYYPVVDYRPDHFVPLGQMLAFGTLVSARKTQNSYIQVFLHFLTGFLITLSIQLHAVALVFIIGLSLFYTADFVWYIWREKTLNAKCLRPIISFGLGALLGTILYYIFNILPVGGIDTYLNVLIHERAVKRGWPKFYGWGMLELSFMFVGLTYLVWRRSSEDKLYLALLFCSAIGLIADTQGYGVPYRGLFIIPFALALVESFETFKDPEKWHLRQLAAIAIVIVALLGQRFRFTDWNAIQEAIQSGHLPQHTAVAFANGVLGHLHDDDKNRVIVGTHELIWALGGYKNFYSPLAEGHAKTQRGWEGTQVWDYLKPDLYIEAPTRLNTPPGLRAYLDREGFQVCETFNSAGYPVKIYRRDCSN